MHGGLIVINKNHLWNRAALDSLRYPYAVVIGFLSMEGTVVNFNAKTGDKISVKMIDKIVNETASFVTVVLEVVDTYPETVTALMHGRITTVVSYVQLKEWGAKFI